MPEIKTCEEYVLSQLFAAEEENFELRKSAEQYELEISHLKEELNRATTIIDTLKKYASHRDEDSIISDYINIGLIFKGEEENFELLKETFLNN